MEPQCDGGTKVFSNDHGYMTKMAAMPIYGKTPSNISRTSVDLTTNNAGNFRNNHVDPDSLVLLLTQLAVYNNRSIRYTAKRRRI